MELRRERSREERGHAPETQGAGNKRLDEGAEGNKLRDRERPGREGGEKKKDEREEKINLKINLKCG